MFSTKEQKAILQCVWQVFAAAPTEEDSQYVQNLVANWDCMSNVDYSNLDEIRMTLETNVLPWVVVAVEEDPFETFSLIQNLSDAKKEAVKKIILEIIEHCSQYTYRAPYAHTLFERCEIPFRIVQKVIGDMMYNRLA